MAPSKGSPVERTALDDVAVRDATGRSTERVPWRPVRDFGRALTSLRMRAGGVGGDGELPSLRDRLRGALLRPAGEKATTGAGASTGAPEAITRAATDKERLVGLVAAPLGAAIGFLITEALIAHDPVAVLADGQANSRHVNVSLYREVLVALLALSVLMVVTALARRRLFLGIVLALYGLTVFNLHYWGFGVPYLLFGAWMLVRSYQLHRSLREATDAPLPGGGPTPPRVADRAGTRRPKGNRRYTPPSP